MQLHRLVVSWSGSSIIGRAVTVLHFDGTNQSAPPVAAVLSAFQTAAGGFPQSVRIDVPNSGDTIDDRTGNLVGAWTGTGGGSATMTGPLACAAGVGACVTWSTGGIVNGKKGPRRLRGRTFFVPLHTGMYDTDGTLAAGALPTLQGLANNLQASGPLAVWHRPTTAGGSDGTSYGVLSNRVRDKVAFLSSRRD